MKKRKKNHPNNLQILREKKGWTQDELANIIGFSRGHISQWEIGEQLPSLETAGKLASLFDVTIEYLFCINISSEESERITIDITNLPDKYQNCVYQIVEGLKTKNSKHE